MTIERIRSAVTLLLIRLAMKTTVWGETFDWLHVAYVGESNKQYFRQTNSKDW